MENDCSYKGKVNIDTEGLRGIWAPPDTLDSLSFQLREEQEVLWHHVKVFFQNKFNYLMLWSWWWKTQCQAVLQHLFVDVT